MSNGLSIPQIHLGVYLTSGNETINAVLWALEAGYRGLVSCSFRGFSRATNLTVSASFDSAQIYHNEREVGQGIRSFLSSEKNTTGLERSQIFYTSKLASNASYDVARKAITKSVHASGLEYIDLFLLHSPYGGKARRLECWKAVEDAIDDGEIKSGGVSNFGVKHLQELLDSQPRIKPAVNQIEVHPFNTRQDITSFCLSHGIVVEAYAPLARALRIKHPTIISCSQKYYCTPAQLMVRWSMQHG